MTSKLMKKIVVLIAAMIMIPLISCNVFAAAPTGESSTGNNDALGPVQVFDVSAGKVVKTIPNDKKFNEWLPNGLIQCQVYLHRQRLTMAVLMYIEFPLPSQLKFLLVK